MVEITRDAIPSSITIEFERDALIRATRVVVVNRNRAGIEMDSVMLLCYDNGKMLPTDMPKIY